MIFFVELWERFTYYVSVSILGRSFVKQLLFLRTGLITFGAFAALVYGPISIGGYVGDHLLDQTRNRPRARLCWRLAIL